MLFLCIALAFWQTVDNLRLTVDHLRVEVPVIQIPIKRTFPIGADQLESQKGVATVAVATCCVHGFTLSGLQPPI